MDIPMAVETARSLVQARYPEAQQAWLAGSVTTGGATATSDLDIVVLCRETAPHRESLRHDGWPVELFVHTKSSLREFVGKDLARRRPTMARLLATGLPLLGDDEGRDLQVEFAAVLAAGPGPVSPADLDVARYFLTDLLADLEGGGPVPEMDAVAVEIWRRTAELLLIAHHWWDGGGKWLIRELQALDATRHTTFTLRLHSSLRAALRDDHAPLLNIADDALALVRGRFWDGFRLTAPPATD